MLFANFSIFLSCATYLVVVSPYPMVYCYVIYSFHPCGHFCVTKIACTPEIAQQGKIVSDNDIVNEMSVGSCWYTFFV